MLLLWHNVDAILAVPRKCLYNVVPIGSLVVGAGSSLPIPLGTKIDSKLSFLWKNCATRWSLGRLFLKILIKYFIALVSKSLIICTTNNTTKLCVFHYSLLCQHFKWLVWMEYLLIQLNWRLCTDKEENIWMWWRDDRYCWVSATTQQ